MLGVHHGRAKAVFALINAGASPTVCDSTGKTALHWAVESQDDTMVSVVLSARPHVDIVAKDNAGNTPLHAAVALGNLEIATMMLEAQPSADLTAVDGTGRTALHWAVAAGHHSIVVALLATAAAGGGIKAQLLDIQDTHGGTALHYAAQLNHVECVRTLTRAGARSLPDREGRHPLQWAVMNSRDGSHSAAVLALAATPGFEVGSRDAEELTAMHLVATVGDAGLAATLLDTFELDLAARDAQGKTPLLTACEAGATDVALELVAHNADISVADNEGRTTLVWSCINGHNEAAMAMLEEGADVNAVDSGGKTPLMYAAYQGMVLVVESLLRMKASPDLQDADGVTALHWASLEGHVSIVGALLAAGANPNTTELADSRSTPLDYAALNGHDGVVRLLRSAGGVPTSELDNELVEVASKVNTLEDQAQAAVPCEGPTDITVRVDMPDGPSIKQTREVATTSLDATTSAEQEAEEATPSCEASSSVTLVVKSSLESSVPNSTATETSGRAINEQAHNVATHSPLNATAAVEEEAEVSTPACEVTSMSVPLVVNSPPESAVPNAAPIEASERAINEQTHKMATHSPLNVTAAEKAEVATPACEATSTSVPLVAESSPESAVPNSTATETSGRAINEQAHNVATRSPLNATAAVEEEAEVSTPACEATSTSVTLVLKSSPESAVPTAAATELEERASDEQTHKMATHSSLVDASAAEEEADTDASAEAMIEFHKAKRASLEWIVREATVDARHDTVFTSRDGESFVAAHARHVESERARRSESDRALMRDMLQCRSDNDNAEETQRLRAAKALAVYKTQHVAKVIESRRKARAAECRALRGLTWA